MIKADIVADSLSPQGNRLTSLIVVMPRIVLSEFNTHRALSRNSASSRAIPFKKMVKSVQENPFIPIAFQKDHKGMQGTEYFTDRKRQDGTNRGEHEWRVQLWKQSMDLAIKQATEIHSYDVTKQLCNRLLEPFMYHTVLVSATEWSNFMALRDHPDAEIHIQAVARAISKAMEESTPKQLKAGEWHLPMIEIEED